MSSASPWGGRTMRSAYRRAADPPVLRARREHEPSGAARSQLEADPGCNRCLPMDPPSLRAGTVSMDSFNSP